MHKIVSISIALLYIFLCNNAHAMRTKQIIRFPTNQLKKNTPIDSAESKIFFNVYYRNWNNLTNVLPDPDRYKLWLEQRIHLTEDCMNNEIEALKKRNQKAGFRSNKEGFRCYMEARHSRKEIIDK